MERAAADPKSNAKDEGSHAKCLSSCSVFSFQEAWLPVTL